MLVIRNAQKKELAAPALAQYRRNLETHLMKNFKDQCEKLGKEGISDAIDHAMDHAKHYGIKSGKDLCLYVNLMFTFGRDFDSDQDLTWARPFFREGRYLARPGAVQELYSCALDNIIDKKAYAR